MASVLSAGTTSNTALNLSADTTGILQFQTNGTTAAMTLDTSQNVGIGTASPVFGSGSGVELYRAGIATYRLSSSGAGVEFRNSSGTGELEVRGAFPLVFGTNATERMRINSAGRVAIGTTESNNRLNVYDTVATTASSTTFWNATFAGINMRNLSDTVNTPCGILMSGGSSGLSISGIANITESLSLGTLAFYTGGQSVGNTVPERMRIDSSGNLLVGATSLQTFSGVTADHALVGTTGNGRWVTGFRNNGNSNPWGLAIGYSAASPNNTTQAFLWAEDSSGLRFNVRSNGGIGNYQANDANLSDEREKANIQLAGDYLNKICAIPVKTFNYIDQNLEEDDGLTLGVIAQDVQKVAPELISESNWGTEDNPKMRLAIYQTDLQYALMKAIQELKAELDATKAEVAALKGVN